MGRGAETIMEAIEDASLISQLRLNNIPCEIRNINGRIEIVITGVPDKKVFNGIMAGFYNEQRKYDKSGFSDFLARWYRGEIK